MTSLSRPSSLRTPRSVMLSITGLAVYYPEENNIRALNGTRSSGSLTWLCYMITQPVGCPPVKCLLALMNDCNMPRITIRHATRSLMLSVMPRTLHQCCRRIHTRSQTTGGGREGKGGRLKQESEKWCPWIPQPCFPVAVQGNKQSKHVLIWLILQLAWPGASFALT